MNVEIIGLIISGLLALALTLYLVNIKKKTQLQKVFTINSFLSFYCCVLLLAQKYFCDNFDIDPIIFERFIYVFTCFSPVAVLFTGIIFANTKITFKKQYLLLFIIPVLSLILIWTNDWHHLLYVNYSTNMEETVYGGFFTIYNLYGYCLYAVRFILFTKIFY